MGGYGVEPNDKGCDFAQTHMIYGTRCLEKKITVNGKVITILQPTTSSSTSTSTTSSGTDDDDDDDANNDNDNDSHDTDENDNDLVIDDDESITEAFISYLVEQDQYDPLTGKTIIEIGSSVVSLVAALACGKSKNENEGNGMGNGVPASVTACHFDENRLRILQHSYQFMNTNKSKDNNCCPLTTKALNLQEIYTDIETCQTITTNNRSSVSLSSSSSSSSFSSLIPDADIIFVTLSPPPPSSYLSSSTFTKEYQYHYILKYLQQTKARIVIYHKNPFAEQLINTSKFYFDTGDNNKSLLYDFPPTYE